MKLNKKIVQSLVVAICMMFLVIVAVGGNKETAGNVALQPRIAGVISQLALNSEDFKQAQIEIADSEQVTISNEDQVVEEEIVQEEAPASEWDGKLVVKVSPNLNVRGEATTESAVVGKMMPGSVATILADEGEWLKIQSGDVTGYVNREFCLFGEEAKAYAEEKGTRYAVSTTDGLFVRSKPGTDGALKTIINLDNKLKVDNEAETNEGWVPVIFAGQTAYVSAEYVNVTMELEEALTIEAYNDILAKERAAAEAAKAGPVTQQTAAIAADVDDVTLLAALIWCEAGNQPYDGKLAVGAVVVNRVKSGRFPNDLRSVIYQSGQFGPVRSGKLANRLQVAQDSSCIQAAQEALGGKDNTGGCLFFNNVRCGRSGLVIGDHVFW